MSDKFSIKLKLTLSFCTP